MIVASRTSSIRTSPDHLLAPPLSGGARVDVCIVGAGLAGMIAAYLLARDHRSVMVIEDGPIGGLQGGFEAAHSASVIETPYRDLEAQHGARSAHVAAQSYAAAIDALEAIVRRERIACEFERLDGYYIAATGEPGDAVEREYDAARRAAVAGVELLEKAPIEGAQWEPCVRYPAQAQFHPAKFLAGLARALTREGARIHCGVRARAVTAGRPTLLATTAGHRIEANVLVTSHAVRANGWIDAAPEPRFVHRLGLRIPRGSAARALYWESGDPARWVHVRSRGSGAGEVLMVGGEDPAAEDDHTAYRYLELERWARSRFPGAREVVQRFNRAGGASARRVRVREPRRVRFAERLRGHRAVGHADDARHARRPGHQGFRRRHRPAVGGALHDGRPPIGGGQQFEAGGR